MLVLTSLASSLRFPVLSELPRLLSAIRSHSVSPQLPDDVVPPGKNHVLAARLCLSIVDRLVNHGIPFAFAAPNADFLMRRISPASNFVNAKHLRPKSFSDAPIR